MTLAQIQSYYFRRTKTNATSFPAADQVIALNVANEYALSLIRDLTDTFLPTAWASADLSTGTLTPLFDSEFHQIIPLYICWQWAVENDKKSALGFERELLRVEDRMKTFYGGRDFRIFTVTIASPGVMTRVNHNLDLDDKVILSTTGALPTGLSANTVYYVVVSDQDTFQLSATRGGTAINTSGSQSGTHYISALKGPVMTTKSINFR